MVEPKDVFRLKENEADTVGLNAELIGGHNGKLMINFTKPIQYLELDSGAAQRLIHGLIVGGTVLWGDDAEKQKPIHLN